jgi:hypothetical protein
LKDKINKLIKIADKLDEMGLSDEADFVDSIIEDESAVIDIPEDEYELLQSIYSALGKSLE